MADELVTPEQYDAIRAAIDITMDDHLITSKVIELPIYLPAARAYVASKTSSVTSPTSSQKQAMTNAIIYYCAALLIPAVPQILEESHSNNQSYKRQSSDWNSLTTSLIERAQEAIASVVTASDDPLASMPQMFSTVPGYRGR